MSKKSSLSSNQLGFFGELFQQAKLTFQLFLDPKVPIYLKALPLAAIAYLIFPFDFLPDVVPGFGQLDDMAILLLGAKIFIELAPQDVVAQYLGQIRTQDDADNIKSGQSNEKEGKLEEDDIIEGIIIDEDEDK
ncbi:MAG: YkvA family protein [Anaerolineales bacterium]|jgi:uncharacterized membrane protein YkvA (DUF1232 family)